LALSVSKLGLSHGRGAIHLRSEPAHEAITYHSFNCRRTLEREHWRKKYAPPYGLTSFHFRPRDLTSS
jgi:hypothetical protein